MPDLRRLPSVDALARDLIEQVEGVLPTVLAVEIARRSVEFARSAAREGRTIDPEKEALLEAARLSKTRLKRVINATGVILHTNLGRAPLHPLAAGEARQAATGYGNLEFDLTEGRRGSRGFYLSLLLAGLTGAEAALVVNNNAAALFLILHTLASGKPVPVSRGELIEIGGSYRLPRLMSAAGAQLVEVGTTNRTRLSDYAEAISHPTALLLKVHPSNYRVMGFAEETTLSGLVALGREHDLPVVYDVGSGLLDAEVPWLSGPPPAWVGNEPGVRQVLAEGADLVAFSGDKLWGGCQAGIIVGRADLVDRLRSNPVARAVRINGPTIAALTHTAELYAERRGREIPFWEMISRPVEVLTERLQRIADQSGVTAEVRMSEAVAGAGSVPGMTVPSPVLVLANRGESLWAELVGSDPAVVARRMAGDLLIDLRAVAEEDDATLASTLSRLCRS
ncbi:MAG: L-seryl-tRNA(Sec) selenium transferase [Acidimicrobiia bacterium]|nr:L-seryl-tRNA(Sec) selenium transferase [Acidimicrobiia bacterium]